MRSDKPEELVSLIRTYRRALADIARARHGKADRLRDIASTALYGKKKPVKVKGRRLSLAVEAALSKIPPDQFIVEEELVTAVLDAKKAQREP